ncbi:MAG: SDR family NAD(P)-dependent oxidoreductase [Acidimicrobiia bacterium]|nr:SDR family NAD(P)-dependent oxidoreductase [Acidimicrobiia bacterium]
MFTEFLDSALEGTVVASFSKLGYEARQNLHDWEPVDTHLGGQSALVTGSTSGLGKAIAEGLLTLGAEVHVTSRSKERAGETVEALNQQGYEGRAVAHSLDTGDFESIVALVSEMTALPNGLDMLINNAGALSPEYRTDARGTELTVSTHLIGPYLLTTRLRPHLTEGARVVFMSSGGMYTQGLDVDHIEMSKEHYRGAVAYARAKRGQVEMVTHLAPQWAPSVIMHSVHPGWVDTAGVDAGIPGFGKLMGPILRTAEQGADTTIWLAATGGGKADAGQFWLDREPRRTVYWPGTGTTEAERRRLIDWLDRMIEPALS